MDEQPKPTALNFNLLLYTLLTNANIATPRADAYEAHEANALLTQEASND